MVTVIHTMVERCRALQYPPAVARLRSGWLVLGERQVLPGYCLLLPDPVVADLNALRGRTRDDYLADMARAGDALLAAADALRINYAIFGNVEPALHAHLFPRCQTEAEATRSLQPWALDWNAAAPFSEQQHGAVKLRLIEALRTARAVAG